MAPALICLFARVSAVVLMRVLRHIRCGAIVFIYGRGDARA